MIKEASLKLVEQAKLLAKRSGMKMYEVNIFSGVPKTTTEKEKIMSEINWDLAPKGADSLKQTLSDDGNLQWFKGLDVYIGDGKYADTVSSRWKTIATRPQQTKTVADKGEKWTHVDDAEDKCFIIHTKGDLAWVSYERSICDCVVPLKDLRPIKPKLTVKEYELLARMAAFFYVRDSEFNDYISSYEVTDE